MFQVHKFTCLGMIFSQLNQQQIPTRQTPSCCNDNRVTYIIMCVPLLDKFRHCERSEAL